MYAKNTKRFILVLKLISNHAVNIKFNAVNIKFTIMVIIMQPTIFKREMDKYENIYILYILTFYTFFLSFRKYSNKRK